MKYSLNRVCSSQIVFAVSQSVSFLIPGIAIQDRILTGIGSLRVLAVAMSWPCPGRGSVRVLAVANRVTSWPQ